MTNNEKTKVINLFAGPGAGKSAIAAYIFAKLKWEGINTEIVLEFAKDKVWEGSRHVLDNQVYIFGKQAHRLYRLRNKVDIIVTDSPILLSVLYDNTNSQAYKNLVLEKHNEYENINFFIKRSGPYSKKGRLQNEEQAKKLDNDCHDFLHSVGEHFICVSGDEIGGNFIVEYVLSNIL